MAYSKRYAGGFVDLPSQTTAIDSTFLNAVEAALLKLFDADPGADGEVMSWIAASSKFGPALLLNKNIDAAAAIDWSKINSANQIDDGDIAPAAAIAKSKLSLTGQIQRADMAAGNKTTVSTLAGGPPVGPSDGDVWIATSVDANGTRWVFQYNAGSASAYKWEFIGGPPVYSQIAASESANLNNLWGNLASDGPVVTLARAGDYTAVGSAQGIVGVGADILYIGIANGNVNPPFSIGAQGAAGNKVSLTAQGVLTGIVAGTTIKLRYLGGNQSNTWSNRSLFVTPERIA